MKKNRESKYKRFVEICMTVVKRVFTRFSSKFSKKTYTQYQLATSICLMKYENKTYRDIVDLLKEIWRYFRFRDSVPHFTTLQKFFERNSLDVWEFLLSKTYQLFKAEVANIGIDSTGFKLNHSSQYYQKRINLERKEFLNHIISVDTDNQAIVASDSKKKDRLSDMAELKPIARKTRKLVRINIVTADRGFDSESNHVCVNEELGGHAIIPTRIMTPKLY